MISAARRAAYEVLRRTFEHEAWTDRVFVAAAERHGLAGRERAQSQRLAYGAVQRRGTCDHFLETLGGRSVAKLDRPVAAALRLGLYELLFSSATPDHAAVNQSVELAKSALGSSGRGTRRVRAAAGFVNGVLRSAARDRDALLGSLDDSTAEGAALAHSYPEWLAQMWWRELGPGDARSLMRAMNEPAETALRVNTLKAEPARILAELAAAEVNAARLDDEALTGPLRAPEALVVRGPIQGPVVERIESGELLPQSRSSQAVVDVLDPQPGERILDLCAGPGVKSTHLAARIQNRGEILSVEIDPGRAAQTAELCERLGAWCIHVIETDAASVDLSAGYDRVLVDPPCSDLGVLASRPDARWRKSPEQIDRLAELQRRILGRAAALLRPGGTLVYSVCTISGRESESVLEAAPGLEREAVIQVRPDRDGSDGFFIARLRRREAAR